MMPYFQLHNLLPTSTTQIISTLETGDTYRLAIFKVICKLLIIKVWWLKILNMKCINMNKHKFVQKVAKVYFKGEKMWPMFFEETKTNEPVILFGSQRKTSNKFVKVQILLICNTIGICWNINNTFLSNLPWDKKRTHNFC